MFRHLSLVLVVVATSTLAAKLPGNFLRCRVSPELDNKPNECLTKAIDEAIVELSKEGNKELGVLDLDPLQISEVVIDHGGDSPINIRLVFSDNVLAGLSKAGVLSVNGKLSSPKDFKLIIDYKNPRVELIGNYKINGRVLVLPIQGDGKSNMTLDNPRGKFELTGKVREKNGKEYLEITGSKLTMDISRLYFKFENLFNGDKALGDNMNKFLNENWDEIYKELRGSIEDAFGQVLGAYSRRILERIQFKNIFLL